MMQITIQPKKLTKKQEFSKTLLIQESILIWIITLACIGLAFFCIANQYLSELGWIATMIACPWTAYGVSQACYYKKSEKENTIGGIIYDKAMGDCFNQVPQYDEGADF